MKKIYICPKVKMFAFEAETMIAGSNDPLTGFGQGGGSGTDLDGTGYGGSTSGGSIEADTRRQGSPIWDAWSN